MLRGMDRGGVLWYPPTNKRAAFAAVYTDRFSGGMLVEHRGESDTADLLEQLGLLPRDAKGTSAAEHEPRLRPRLKYNNSS
jgi:hypothetical protein